MPKHSLLARVRNALAGPAAPHDTTTVSIPHQATARVKITRANGAVEFADVPMDGLEVYLLPTGEHASTYPANTRPKED